MNSRLTFEQAVESFSYDETSGHLTWRASKNPSFIGKQAGSLKADGYITLWFDGLNYQQHRVIWLLSTGVWPSAEIDHINGIRSDNRLCNLREATRNQNNCNRKTSQKNTSGFRGVTYHKKTGKWQAALSISKKSKYLGLFETAELAAQAYNSAQTANYGAFSYKGECCLEASS